MFSEEETVRYLSLLEAHRSTLMHYLKQQALLGVENTPPAIYHGINDAAEKIRKISSILRENRITVPEYVDNELHLNDFVSEYSCLSNKNVSPNLVANTSKSNCLFSALKCAKKLIGLPGEFHHRFGSFVVYATFSYYKNKTIRAYTLDGNRRKGKEFYSTFVEYEEEELLNRCIAAVFRHIPEGNYEIENHWIVNPVTKLITVSADTITEIQI